MLRESEIKQKIYEVLETIEIATKRGLMETTMIRLKERSVERILQIIKGKINEYH